MLHAKTCQQDPSEESEILWEELEEPYSVFGSEQNTHYKIGYSSKTINNGDAVADADAAADGDGAKGGDGNQEFPKWLRTGGGNTDNMDIGSGTDTRTSTSTSTSQANDDFDGMLPHEAATDQEEWSPATLVPSCKWTASRKI